MKLIVTDAGHRYADECRCADAYHDDKALVLWFVDGYGVEGTGELATIPALFALFAKRFEQETGASPGTLFTAFEEAVTEGYLLWEGPRCQ